MVETWLNDTLKEAEFLDIPGVLLKPQNKLPINRYSLDRLSLSNENLGPKEIDRIYRALFVYTTGFYELIRQNLSKCLSLNYDVK